MGDMLVTGSPAPGRKEVWVEGCEGALVLWAGCVGSTNEQRAVQWTVVDEVAGDGAKDWRVEKRTLRRI